MQKLKLQELNRLTTAEYHNQEKLPIVLVLDNIRSLNNVGSAFRTADALLVKKIYLAGITGTPPHRDIHKTALGAQDIVQWEHAPTISELCGKLKEEGYTILAIEQTSQSVNLQDYTVSPTQKYALIFGNEVDGVSDEALPYCDAALEIPQFGTKHSFNVSVTMGILLWEFVRQLKL
jgi:23S rRNA (guanosine2251-2'-O)-methyltransferase